MCANDSQGSHYQECGNQVVPSARDQGGEPGIIPSTVVTNALKVLNDGLYITEYNEHKQLGTPGTVQETPGVKKVWAGDQEVRVYDVA